MLAKSNPRLTLEEHIEDCLHIWDCLQKCFPQINNLPGISQNFWAILWKCLVLHDLGKTHREFQRLLSAPDQPNQWLRQRHELFSMPFVEGLNGISEQEHHLIRLVVAGHHKDFDRLMTDYISNTYHNPNGWEMSLHKKLDFWEEFERNVDINWVLDFLMQEKFYLDVVSPKKTDPYDLVNRYRRESRSVNLKEDDRIFNLLLAVGAFKHCDHLGSARIQNLPVLTTHSFAFLDYKRTEIQLKGQDFYTHQLQCATTIGNLILTAPTGSGKTESALLWAREQIRHQGAGRVFYVLPFTASINAMFERLGQGFGQDIVAMLHGKLSDYLYQFFEDNQLTTTDRNEEIKLLKEKFKTLAMPVKVVTPFQLLKCLFGLRGFEQGFFEWANGFFIFDEIHAYDSMVFAQIVALLEFATQRMDVKVMIMTATLPSFMRQELEAILPSFTEVFADEALLQSFDRHHLRLEQGLLTEHLDMICAALRNGQKVLVVCNTIKNSQLVFKALRNEVRRAVLLHGGFNGEDRARHEENLKDGEKENENPIQLLVGTQAIEVSLDIDYDIIFTEPAPIDPLIQRFGRVNRQRKKGICEVVVFDLASENDKFIYPPIIVKRTLDVLKKIIFEKYGFIHERYLQGYMDEVYPEWDVKQKQNFDLILSLLRTSVGKLKPLLPNPRSEEEFYKQFDGIKVLPARLRSRFVRYIEHFDFIKAESLKVQIRKGKFAQLSRNSTVLQKRTCLIPKAKGEDSLEIDFYEIAVKYDSELGLLYDEQEVFLHDYKFI